VRVVLDTNVLVSSMIASRGTIGRVLQLLRDDEFVAVYSKPMIHEVIEVLRRPRIQEKYQIGSQEIYALLRLIVFRGSPVVPITKIYVCRDSKDNKFLEAAVDGEADCIVTGDMDLLTLHPFRGVAILSPTDSCLSTSFVPL